MDLNVYRAILTRVPRNIESWKAWRHIGIDLSLWGLMLAGRMSAPGLVSNLCVALLFSFFCFRSFGMMHDCVHQATHANRTINNLFGWAYGCFCFLPFSGWRSLHLDHHLWTGNYERDPSAKILFDFKRSGFRVGRAVAWAWRTWIPLLGLLQHVVFWKATLSKRNYLFLPSLFVYLGSVSYVLGPMAVVMGVVVYMCMVEIINFPHHLGMIQNAGTLRTPPHEQGRYARSCIYPKWFAHLILLNFNLHTEHHLYPSHPWYQLDEIHEQLLIAGVPINMTEGNGWILRNRPRPVHDVLIETFEPAVEKRAA